MLTCLSSGSSGSDDYDESAESWEHIEESAYEEETTETAIEETIVEEPPPAEPEEKPIRKMCRVWGEPGTTTMEECMSHGLKKGSCKTMEKTGLSPCETGCRQRECPYDGCEEYCVEHCEKVCSK